MATNLVPRTEWGRFLEGFGRRHEGSLATVRVLHPSFGSQVEARDLALEGIVFTSEGESGPISLHLAVRPDRHVEHEVRDPRQLWVETSRRGAERALEIVEGDDCKTILEFRSPALPEEVDGILER